MKRRKALFNKVCAVANILHELGGYKSIRLQNNYSTSWSVFSNLKTLDSKIVTELYKVFASSATVRYRIEITPGENPTLVVVVYN